ncbi:Desaturase 1 [Carabus blaptoides fortunei]
MMKNGNVDEYKGKLPTEIGTDYTYKRQIVWFNAIGFLVLHLIGAYGLILGVTSAKLLTSAWMIIVVLMAGEALPVSIPVYLWDETYYNSLFVAFFARTVLLLNITWLVNSAAHIWGTRPFDKFLQPVESKFVAIVSIGEGWHNYHHAFPWDYRASELGSRFNFTSYVIDILSYLGLAYDLRVASDSMIQHRVKKAGDGTHHKYGLISEEIPQAEEDLDEQYVETLKELGVFGGMNKQIPHAVQAGKSC